MPQLLTTKQVAKAIGISESSLKRWCDAEKIPSIRTAGNHRRLRLTDIVQLVRSGDLELQNPESLGLPANSGKGKWCLDRGQSELHSAITAGNGDAINQIIFDLFLSGITIAKICDKVITPVLHGIGEEWQTGEVSVYQERLGTNLISRTFYRLQQTMPRPIHSAPLAIGGSIEGDPYTIPTLMAESVLHEVGFHATSLGSNVPLESLALAVCDKRPRIMWLSLSKISDTKRFIGEYEKFYEKASQYAAVAVGGRALNDEIRQQMQATAFCNNMVEFANFAKALRPQPPGSSSASDN